MSIRFLILLVLVLLGQTRLEAAFGRLPDGRLDQKAIRKAFMESEFEKVSTTLESFQKAKPAHATREDWIFTYKYLGVIYAADSNRVVRAESNFNRLLQLAPNIELVDMFVPPSIQNLFDRTKTRFHKNMDYSRRFDEMGNPIEPKPIEGRKNPAPEGNPPKIKPGSSGKAWVWWGAAAAVVGVGAGYYVWSEYIRSPDDKTFSY